ncbi:Pentatricopeptide repeat-containing protein -mitochondrial [Striga hermonthica]|uniref:Pentatricopeptide repeat-containing protein -mitochondrial n=1 Tax=Striga hermonthica TaxID=68872 RepID=A0A9N7MT90_STRHE|nr:Pentatricopeptide repeat-containing protein -mitochondrial [Striga hermonthica]
MLALWNSILKHYSLGASPQDSIFLFKFLRSLSNTMSFDSFTYSYLIKACANMKWPGAGNGLHCLSTKAGFGCHVHVQTALVNMYVDCGCLVDAQNVFEKMPKKNLVTWNVLITGFIKWGEIEFARAIFEVMPEKNVISWTGLIDGYTRMNRFDEALFSFRQMAVHEGIKPTEVTLLAIFPSIWNTGCLLFCQVVHAYGEKSGLNSMDIRVMNCLVDAYARCGSIESAFRVFEDIDDMRKNLVSWTSIISGFAMHGMAVEASGFYEKMENKGLKPNEITFLSMLSACSHGGLVEEGLDFYGKMVDFYRISPGIKHYGTLIDMLGRAGRLEEAERIALSIPNEIGNNNAVVWRTLLGACSFHGDVERGERVTRRIVEMEREYGGDYVLMSNIFCGAGRFEDSERVRRLMDEQNALKVRGIVTLV